PPPHRGAAVIATLVAPRWTALREDLRKVPAFTRRDLLVLWSYRLSFFSDWLSLLGQIVVFYFIGQLVDPAAIPAFGGSPATYVEFVAVGLVFASFMQVSLARVSSVIRQEQLMGTLESLLLTPTTPAMIQLGSVAFDLVYVPLRSGIFLALVWVLLDVRLSLSGILPAAALLVCFVPFVWGLGVAGAGGVLTFRRGGAVVGLAGTVLSLSSGTYFPIDAMPRWLQPLAEMNPLTITLRATREALLGGQGWSVVGPAAAVLLPAGVVSLALGVLAFRAALRRERRRGTLGLY
ncbi:MAG: ABC transporter permease, partial [Acidimicrobiales bacterium]